MDSIKSRILATRDTTQNWNELRTFIPLRGEVIIYTDHGTIQDEFGNDINVPGIKIGDGNAYLIDLPFVGNDERHYILSELRSHEGNQLIHVTQEDRDFWNAKLNYQIEDKTLVLNRN